MATLSEIRDRLEVVLSGVTGIAKVVKRPGETAPPALPAVVLQEPRATFAEGAADRGLDSWEIGLLVLVSLGDYAVAQEQLDGFLTRSGSIREALARDPALGLVDGTSAFLDRMDEYGPVSATDGTRMLGATLRLVVRTSG